MLSPALQLTKTVRIGIPWGHESFRWVASFVLVLGLHIGGLLAVLGQQSVERVERGEPMAAIMMELAPLPTAPATPSIDVPVGEMQPELEAIEQLEPEPEPVETVPELVDIEHAEAVLPPEPEETVEEPVEVEDIQQAQQAQAPVSVDAPLDEVAAAPRQGAVSLNASDAAMRWQELLAGHMELHKRYPRRAMRRRQEAIVYVRVTINRDGYVIDYQLEQASRYELLNKESLELITRAEPLPPPPQEVVGNIIQFVVPIDFSVRR